MEKSKALVIKAKDELEFMELVKPEVGDYEVLFKTIASSLCTIEQRTYKGTRNYQYPFLGGHESSGIIEAVGKGVVEVVPGDKVIFTSGYCNQCEMDRSNRGTQCLHKRIMPKRISFSGTVQGGGLSEYLVIPGWQVIKLPQDVDMSHAALTEPLACCIHSINKARIQFADTVVIIGLGIMGYFQMKLAQMRGARIIISEMDPSRQEKAIKNGAFMVVDPSKEDVVAAVKAVTQGQGANVVINTIPNPVVWKSAIEMLAPYGRLLAYSSQDKTELIGVDFGVIHSREIEFIGTVNPTIEDNYVAVKLIGLKMIDISQVIDSEFDYKDGKAAFERACVPGTYRVVIRF